MSRKIPRSVVAYSTIGIQFAAVLLFFVYAGFRLDEYFGTNPWFVVAGTALGMASGFYHLLKGLKDIDRVSREEKEEKPEARRKWM